MKNIIFLIVGVAATLGIISATAVTNQVFAAECDDGTGEPAGNPCTETSTEREDINPGQEKETTTVNENTCTNSKGDPVGSSGNCRGTGQTQESVEISSDCKVSAKNAHGGEGQETGRKC